MRMIDSLDAGLPASGHDLWAEICPRPSDLDPGNFSHEFADSFLCPVADGAPQRGLREEGLHNTEVGERPPYNPKPWAPLQDSEVYLASLERRLQKIKGASSEVSSKDMLRSLSQAKKECWDRFLHESFESEAFGGDDMDDGTLEHLKRWLQPEKVAINAEEVQCLIPAEATADGKRSPEPAEQ
uniref:Coiled-coil domain containing 32 n=1 Tax=Leptobrachium leishanense TaxID=445787 RepID=A0A8C5MQE8_9ANUR